MPLLTCGLVIAAVAAPTMIESPRSRGDGAAGPRLPPRDERAFAEAVKRVRRMPTEIYRDPRHLSVAEAWRRLGPKARACLERRDLETRSRTVLIAARFAARPGRRRRRAAPRAAVAVSTSSA